MNDYDVVIRLSSIPAEDDDKALDQINDVLKVLKGYDNVKITIKKQGEWLEWMKKEVWT